MKKALLKVALAGMLCLSSNYIFPQVNLIPNGDFELGPDSSSVGWCCWVDSSCSVVPWVNGPDFWYVASYSPDRMVEGTIFTCSYDNLNAQSGKSYVVFAYSEAGKTTLIYPLLTDSFYILSAFFSLQTFNGGVTLPARTAFVFNNDADSIPMPYATLSNQWQYFDTIFKASANATELKIRDIELNGSTTNIDNISLQKISSSGINQNNKEHDIVSLVPNPPVDFVNVISENELIYSVHFFNMLGERIEIPEYQISSDHFRFDISALASGVYYVKVRLCSGLYITKKILKL